MPPLSLPEDPAASARRERTRSSVPAGSPRWPNPWPYDSTRRQELPAKYKGYVPSGTSPLCWRYSRADALVGFLRLGFALLTVRLEGDAQIGIVQGQDLDGKEGRIRRSGVADGKRGGGNAGR